MRTGIIYLFDYPRYDNNGNDDDTATWCVKFGLTEDDYIKRQQQCVKFGCWITAGELRVAGWYHSTCMIGSDAKPI